MPQSKKAYTREGVPGCFSCAAGAIHAPRKRNNSFCMDVCAVSYYSPIKRLDSRLIGCGFACKVMCSALAPIGSPIPPFGSKKKTTRKGWFSFWRRHPESDRGMRVLQTLALPLGYGAL